MCSSRKYPYPPPPKHTHRATEISRGGGIQKEAISDGVGAGGGVASREFFPGAPSKIDELLKTISCSVEQAISHLTVNSLLKQ